MDLLELIFMIFGSNSSHSKDQKAEYFIAVSSILVLILNIISIDILKDNNNSLLLILIIACSCIMSFSILYFLNKLKDYKPKTFGNYVAYLLGLILLFESISVFIIHYFKL
ncbi:hypothetical protein [Faecalibacter bovis]|uniref:Uncharacterized protein n=1 Tax=Faecalibacter bovis TaxID=2898187 RepID=A0ABX7XEL3_9FLAO|nr:hypothetical protein [Faecalibacter bovis]QTV06381.1 hypothetical protein J9309_03360 [Faecalibacter bovis]